MWRSILSIFVGFVIIAVIGLGGDAILKQIKPQSFTVEGAVSDPSLLMLILAYTVLAIVLAGYATASLAPKTKLGHALVLGIIQLVLSIAATVNYFYTAPAWWHALSLAAIIPAVWIGGKLRVRQS